MRISFFLPSATEIVCALRLQDQLYGVTFECAYPPETRTKPIVVAASLAQCNNSRWYVVDANAYMNRSGPRLVCELAMFAQMLHPECCSRIIPAGGAALLSAE